MALIGSGKVDLRPLITHSLPLAKTPDAYDMFREKRGGVLKIALRP
jgi:threonine dehydrogenase-like Zn-dependent dehydrogenase